MRDELGADGDREWRWFKPAAWMVVIWIIVALLVVFPYRWWWL